MGKSVRYISIIKVNRKKCISHWHDWEEEEIFLSSSIMLDTIPSKLWLQFYVDAGEAELLINSTNMKTWVNIRSNCRHYRH